MATEDEKSLFLTARASVSRGLPILVDPGDFDLIPPGEAVFVAGGFFSLAKAHDPNKPRLYDKLFKLIHNGGNRPRKLGIPIGDEDRSGEYLPVWNETYPFRKFAFEAAPRYKDVYYKWIVAKAAVTHYPRFL